MVRIFTRTGDHGETGRLDGTRVVKNDPLIELNGTIDECNALLGVVRSFNSDVELNAILRHFQQQLITAGTDVSNTARNPRFPAMTDAEVIVLEELIDRLEAKLPPLNHFILPAGGCVSAHLHLARTAARKVERRLATFMQTGSTNPVLAAYFNRLSDALFVLARHAAHLAGVGDDIGKDPTQ